LLLREPALPEEFQGAIAERLASLLWAARDSTATWEADVGGCMRWLKGRACCALLVDRLQELAWCAVLLDPAPAPPAEA
jgi:hypothetical protein